MKLEIKNNKVTGYVCDEDEFEADVVIPEGITAIGELAFRYCYALKSIELPDSVTEIGAGAFFQCDSLEEINIPDSVKIISRGVFLECRSLKKIKLPKNLKEIRDNAFYNCYSLETISLPENIRIGNSVFVGCINIRTVYLPKETKIVGKIFDYCYREDTDFTIKRDGNVTSVQGCSNAIVHLLLRFFVVPEEKQYEMLKKLPEYSRIPTAILMLSTCPKFYKYLKKRSADTVRTLINNENISILSEFLKIDFVTKTTIDRLIAFAVEHTQQGGSPEPQVLLQDYKRKRFGFKKDTFDSFML